MNVQVFPEDKEDKNKLDYDAFIDFVHQQRYKSPHDSIYCDCFNSIIKNFLHLDLLLKTLMSCLFDLLFKLWRKRGKDLFQSVSELLCRRVGPEGINHIDQSLIRSRNMLLVLIFRLLSRHHHRTGVINWLHWRYILGIWCLSLMFVFNVGIQRRIA